MFALYLGCHVIYLLIFIFLQVVFSPLPLLLFHPQPALTIMPQMITVVYSLDNTYKIYFFIFLNKKKEGKLECCFSTVASFLAENSRDAWIVVVVAEAAFTWL